MNNKEVKKDSLSQDLVKKTKANLEQMNEINESQKASSDIYAKNEGKDPETGVEIPTEDAVEEAKEWVDNQNQR